MENLSNLEALDEAEELTPLGLALSKLPIDVIIGKILLLATVREDPKESFAQNKPTHFPPFHRCFTLWNRC